MIKGGWHALVQMGYTSSSWLHSQMRLVSAPTNSTDVQMAVEYQCARCDTWHKGSCPTCRAAGVASKFLAEGGYDD